MRCDSFARRFDSQSGRCCTSTPRDSKTRATGHFRRIGLILHQGVQTVTQLPQKAERYLKCSFRSLLCFLLTKFSLVWNFVS
eukprot:11369_4